MSSSLSKAARTRGCQDQSYLAMVRTVTCQSTARSTFQTVRRVGYAEAFTACYMSLMATAAVLDATHKESKKKELDRQLNNAKVRLERLQQEYPAGSLSDGQVVSETSETDRKHIEALGSTEGEVFLGKVATTRERDAQTRAVDQELEKALAKQGEERWCSGKEKPLTWPSYTAVTSASTSAETLDSPLPTKEQALRMICLWPRDWLIRDSQCRPNLRGQTWRDFSGNLEEIIRAEREDHRLQQPEPATELQFSQAVNMHVALVDKLMEEVYSEKKRPPALDSGFNFIRMLKSDGYPCYRNAVTEPEKAMEERKALCEANWTIVKEWKYKSRQTMVSKMCRNLLVCDFLPGVHAFNTLILGFTQLGQIQLARIVVDSLLLHSHYLSVTRGTVLSLIHHYCVKRDILGFQVLMRRMFGYDPRGLLRRRSLLQTSNWEYLRNWVRTEDVNISRCWVTLRYDADASVFEALLRALLDLQMLPAAARVFVICLQEQVPISARLLDDMVRACIDCIDHAAARVLMPGFLDHMNQIISILSSADLPSGLLGRLRRFIILSNSQVLPGGSPKSETGVERRIRRLNAANRLDKALSDSDLETGPTLVKYVEAWESMPITTRFKKKAKPAFLRFAENPIGELLFANLAKRMWLRKEVHKSAKLCQLRAVQVIEYTIPRRLWTLFGIDEKLDDLLQRHKRMLTPGSSLHRLAVLHHVYDLMKKEFDQWVRNVLVSPTDVGASSDEAAGLTLRRRRLIERAKRFAAKHNVLDGATKEPVSRDLDSWFEQQVG